MPTPIIEFFWDVGSPYTYLASTQIEKVAQTAKASVKWRPFLLGGIFRDTGNRPPVEVPAKGAYMLKDLQTWAAYYQVPFSFPASFPVNSLLPMRTAVAAEMLGRGKEYALTVMHLYWAEGKDPSIPEIIKELLKTLDLDPEKIDQMVQTPEVKETLKANSAEAVSRGAFGAPTFFVGDKMFWGNDRLGLLEAYLKGNI